MTTKLGQWLSTRPDVIPISLCRELACLHDAVPSHSALHTRRQIEEAFGRSPDDLFLQLSEEPIGSGCVAQVHTALAADGQTRYAIKVLHPEVEQLIAVDLHLLRAGVAVLQGALAPLVPGLRWLSLTECVDEFCAFMTSQLDLQVEAANLSTFNANFDGSDTVVFPKPVRVSQRVLVESYLDGVPLSSILRDNHTAESGRDAERHRPLARAGLRAFLTMMLQHNFVHADLHPGNIIVCDDAGGGSVRLGFVDAGLVVRLEERDRTNFLALFRAIASGDGEEAGALILTHARASDCADPAAFKGEMRELITRAGAGTRGAFNLSQVHIGDVLLDVTSLVRRHRVQLDPTFANLVMAIVVLEGLGRRLDPNLDLFSVALPLLAASVSTSVRHKP